MPLMDAAKKRTVPSQRSLRDQLEELILLANEARLYDAADYVRDRLEMRRPPR